MSGAADVRGPDRRVGVVIPAHNEAAVLGRTLRTLLATGCDDLDVVVVCNGCTDRTAEVARAASPSVRVLEIPEASKAAAMRAGNLVTEIFPRIHLDADVEITGDDARTLAAAVGRLGIHAAAPARTILTDDVSRVVRRYYQVWEALPQVRRALFGRGVLAVSQEGQARLDALPQLLSDDLAASEAFAEHETLIHEGTHAIIRPPTRLGDLIRRRIRVTTGNAQADAQGIRRPASRTTLGTLWALMVARPQLIPRIPVFVAVTCIARWRARPAIAARDFSTWQRDESSRA